jgi:hypothetical protein
MTYDEIKNLKLDDVVGYIHDPTKSTAVLVGKVTHHGPRLTGDGTPIAWMPELLEVEIDGGPVKMSWEPVNWPEGIPNLVLPTAN